MCCRVFFFFGVASCCIAVCWVGLWCFCLVVCHLVGLLVLLRIFVDRTRTFAKPRADHSSVQIRPTLIKVKQKQSVRSNIGRQGLRLPQSYPLSLIGLGHNLAISAVCAALHFGTSGGRRFHSHAADMLCCAALAHRLLVVLCSLQCGRPGVHPEGLGCEGFAWVRRRSGRDRQKLQGERKQAAPESSLKVCSICCCAEWKHPGGNEE